MASRVQPETGEVPFLVVPGDPASRVIVHVPHSSTFIPEWVRRGVVLDDIDLTRELELMTDARTDELARLAASRCDCRPWLFVNQLSRLVIDPERFPDPAHEPMAAPEIGMGAVYTRTAHGAVLRDTDEAHERQLMDSYFDPYSRALADLVAERCEALGRVTIIDLHSYPVVELPYERHHHPDAVRPPLCIGADDFHTTGTLIDLATRSFASLGHVAVNAPFAGTYVPLRHYGVDRRVESLMIELRRDTYLARDADALAVARMLAALISAIG